MGQDVRPGSSMGLASDWNAEGFISTLPDMCEESLGRLCRSLGGPENGFWSCLHSWWRCQTLRGSSLKQVGTQMRWLPDSGSLCHSEEEKVCWGALGVLLTLRKTQTLMRLAWLRWFGQVRRRCLQQRHYLRSRALQWWQRSSPADLGIPAQTKGNRKNWASATPVEIWGGDVFW